LVFALSVGGKCRDLRGFRQSIINFQLIPNWLSGVLAFLCLGGECAVLVGIIVGSELLLPAFLLAGLLLFLFSGAMASVLVRNLRTSCHCFGKSDHPVSVGDIWRNTGFLCCVLGGCAILLWSQHAQNNPEVLIWLPSGGVAVVFVLIWLQLSEIVALFRY
jgi:hypothetical protein